MRNRKQQGFTLIELLIVIAIIGILAAVLIPNLLSARNRAFDAAAQACASSIATAQEIYSIDNDGSYALTSATLIADEDNTNCDSVAWGPTADTASTSYEFTASHNNSDTTYTVTPGGIQ